MKQFNKLIEFRQAIYDHGLTLAKDAQRSVETPRWYPKSVVNRFLGTAARVCLQRLVRQGWLLVRRGSKSPYAWEMEYRPDCERIAADL